MRALRALGIEPGVVHLNEGHAARAPNELAGEALRAGESLQSALQAARSRTVFTTHMPVPAGNDTYPKRRGAARDRPARRRALLSVSDVIALGRTNPEDADQPFGVTQAALRLSRAANAVSRRHGEVAREMWHALWPDRPVDKVPIGYVTNGADFPTWVGTPMRELLDRHLGPDWLDRAADRDLWSAVDQISDAELWRCASDSARSWCRSSASAAPRTVWLAATPASTSKPPRGRSIPTCSRSASRDASPPTSGSGSHAGCRADDAAARR